MPTDSGGHRLLRWRHSLLRHQMALLAQELGLAHLLTAWMLPQEGQGETPAEVVAPRSRSPGRQAAQR